MRKPGMGNVEIRESGTEAAGWRIIDFGLPIGDWAEAEFRKLNVESGKAGNGGDGISEGRIWNSGNQETELGRTAVAVPRQSVDGETSEARIAGDKKHRPGKGAVRQESAEG